MFDWLTIDAILQQARPVVAWLLAMQADIEAKAWHALWATTPWWFRLILLVYAAGALVVSARVWARRLFGVRL